MSFATKSFVKLAVSVIIVFLALASTFSYSAHAYTSDEATSKIAEADSKVKQAFDAVSDAAEAGANVSSLALRLNEAGGLFVVSLFGWRFVKNRYFKSVLEMKPEGAAGN